MYICRMMFNFVKKERVLFVMIADLCAFYVSDINFSIGVELFLSARSMRCSSILDEILR